MAITTRIKGGINHLLRPFNLQVDTCTAVNAERKRIEDLSRRGAFDRPIYITPPSVQNFNPEFIINAYDKYGEFLAKLSREEHNSTGFSLNNSWFTSPDAEILYLLVRTLKPRTIVEIGCGNSTRVSRQAISDGALDTQLIAIDPAPRAEITKFVDRFERIRLEDVGDSAIFNTLQENDILFIDSSHEARVGNDVAHLFCRIIPSLRSGVAVHVHDIYLPFDCAKFPHWGEQYVLHALLAGGRDEVIWPGYYVQKTCPDLMAKLSFPPGEAKSFWFRKS